MRSQATITIEDVSNRPMDEIRIEPERSTAPEGSRVELRCIIPGRPPTPDQIRWTKVLLLEY
jgi:hypothetical protein